jgi:hypothetical protein
LKKDGLITVDTIFHLQPNESNKERAKITETLSARTTYSFSSTGWDREMRTSIQGASQKYIGSKRSDFVFTTGRFADFQTNIFGGEFGPEYS